MVTMALMMPTAHAELSAYAIDLTPVTNGEYEKFLNATGYKPRQNMNFLKHWVDGTPSKS
jgi:formylglycine-generating enzyme required for sulfatase activity